MKNESYNPNNRGALSRRSFLRRMVVLPLVPLVPTAVRLGFAQERQVRSPNREKLRKFGVEFSPDFTEQELGEANEVLEKMQKMFGDLRKFSLSFSKLPYNAASQRFKSAGVVDTDNPLNGYPTMGECDIKDLRHPVTIAPKAVLDKFADWEQKTGQKPKGEEAMFHGFRWVLVHEMAHAISYKIGIGYELRLDLFAPKNQSQTYREWNTLSGEIRKNAKPLSRDANNDWVNERPEGYPTQKSYFGGTGAGSNGEIFVDCIAYLVTGSNYAKDDKFLKRRLNLVKNISDKIKKNNLPIVDEDQYYDLHINGKK